SIDSKGGGAVIIRDNSMPSFINCTFDGNVVDRTGTDADNNEASGGAVFITWNSNSTSMKVVFESCTFKNNIAKGNSTAKGGALYAFESQVDLINCLFHGNTAWSSVDGNKNNAASGGAINIQTPSYYSTNENSWKGGQVKIINSTIVNNLVKTGSSDPNDAVVPGVYMRSDNRSEKPWIFNSIVWGNKTGQGADVNQVYFGNESGWKAINLDYNVVQNSNEINHLQEVNSFETDPTFVDSANG
ncbi:uncharacterized protein METZ01_LOCUS479331, partial [marine metagenome]